MECFEQKKIPNFRLVEDSGSCDLSASAIALADSEQDIGRSFLSNNFRFKIQILDFASADYRANRTKTGINGNQNALSSFFACSLIPDKVVG
ncbi:hypothetical protein [Microcoleus sp. N9_A1]|uniref:hypothetical protein n=1 Tax=Microcoleus sp. N9_A1 TaxID=3055380 RepID=UPI002FD1F848